MDPSPASGRQPCAGGIVFDEFGRLLLIRRGKPPSAGSWSVPGGRCRENESAADACVREVAEETGLTVQVLRLVGRVQRGGPGGLIYDIDDFLCRPAGGVLRAGDDAVDVRWVDGTELHSLQLAPGLYDALAEWGQLPH